MLPESEEDEKKLWLIGDYGKFNITVPLFLKISFSTTIFLLFPFRSLFHRKLVHGFLFCLFRDGFKSRWISLLSGHVRRRFTEVSLILIFERLTEDYFHDVINVQFVSFSQSRIVQHSEALKLLASFAIWSTVTRFKNSVLSHC